MKIGSICMAVAILSVLGLTQGCVTTESQGSGRGAGAKTKGPFKHQHKGKEVPAVTKAEWEEEFGPVEESGSLYEEEVSSSDYQGGPNQGATQYGETEIYIVQKGDVLSQLAVDFDTTTASLVDMNGLSNPDVLYVGQELRVPAGVKGTTSKPSSGEIKAGGTYTIQKGDTLSEIAVAAGVTIDDLRSVNGIKGDIIMAGEELTIPAYGTVPTNTRKAKTTTAKQAEPEPQPVVETSVEPEPAPLAFDEPAAEPVADTGAIVVDEVMYPGETLDDKARQYGVSKAEIMRLNGITDESQIKEGQTIRIPVAD